MAGGLKPECPVAVELSDLRGSQMNSIVRRGELLPHKLSQRFLRMLVI